MKVKVKKLHKDAVVPKYAKPGDAGLDLTAVGISTNPLFIEYDTCLAFEIPEGYVGLVFPRSSITTKDLMLKNSVGIIDSTYRGSVKIRFYKTEDSSSIYGVGERVAQIIIVPYPQIELEESESLSFTDRGSGGFGSTGV